MKKKFSNKKIAFIATVYRHLEAFHLPFINLFQNKGYEVHAYAAFDFGKSKLEKNGVICHDVCFSRNPFSPRNSTALYKLYSSLKKEQYLLIHVHTPVASVIGRIAAKLAGIKHVIYTAHGFHFYSGAPLINWAIYYPIERFLAKWTDYLITINQEDYDRAKRFKVREKVLLVPGVGVNTDEFASFNNLQLSETRKNLNLTEKDFVILYVAELVPNKNHKQIIDAIEILSSQLPTLKVLIAGSGILENDLKEMVKKKGLERFFIFLGFRRDIPQLMNICDLVVLLSKREGLPKCLMEALAAGKPILATDIRGNRDLVKHEYNGFLVPLGDYKTTANYILKLLNNSELGRTMGKRGKELSKKYQIESVSKYMEQVYIICL